MALRRYVIIGDGAAGLSAAQQLRKRDQASSITVVSADPHPAYYRAALTNYLLGELRDEQVWAVTPSFFGLYRIERLHLAVSGVDASRRELVLSTGGRLPYDQLLVASGSRARPAPFEGGQLPGVVTLRTLQDARWLLDNLRQKSFRKAAVVGGGPLALELALALKERGVHVTSFVREPALLSGSLDGVASDLIAERFRAAGIDLRFQETIQAASANRKGKLESVSSSSGLVLPVDLVGVGIGVVCNTEFLQGSPVTLGPSGGIVVDEQMRTSAHHIHAAGDVAEFRGQLTQLWEPARRQGAIAASTMAGGSERYEPGTLYFASRFADLDFASVGRVDRGDDVVVDQPKDTGLVGYKKLVFEGTKLVGALLLGQRDAHVRRRGRLFKALVDGEVDVSTIRHRLLDDGFDLSGWLDKEQRVAPVVRSSGPQKAAPRPPAKMKGTQAIRLDAIAHAQTGLAGVGAKGTQAITPEMLAQTAAVPGVGAAMFDAQGAVKKSPMLTIGLPAAGQHVAIVQGRGRQAWLEGPFGKRSLDTDIAHIGRDPKADVVVEDPQVAFLHAEIVAHRDEHYLRDAGSASGTFVGSDQVTIPHRLSDGDRIRLGQTEIVFRSGEVADTVDARVVSAATTCQLAIMANGTSGPTFRLDDSINTIGRDPACAVQLDDQSASRRHASVSRVDGRWFLADLHSLAGTLVNDRPVAPGSEVPLSQGDRVQIGTTTLVFGSP